MAHSYKQHVIDCIETPWYHEKA